MILLHLIQHGHTPAEMHARAAAGAQALGVDYPAELERIRELPSDTGRSVALSRLLLAGMETAAST